MYNFKEIVKKILIDIGQKVNKVLFQRDCSKGGIVNLRAESIMESISIVFIFSNKFFFSQGFSERYIWRNIIFNLE